MKTPMAMLLATAMLAAVEVLPLPAAADMPMSPVYPTASRPKRVPPAAQPAAATGPAVVAKPSAVAPPSKAKTEAVAPPSDAKTEAVAPPAKQDGAGPTFEAAIPPPITADTPEAPAPTAEPSTPAPQKAAAAKPRPRRPAHARRYVSYPHPYRVAPGWHTGYADPQRGWGGGRYGPSPVSDAGP